LLPSAKPTPQINQINPCTQSIPHRKLSSASTTRSAALTKSGTLRMKIKGTNCAQGKNTAIFDQAAINIDRMSLMESPPDS